VQKELELKARDVFYKEALQVIDDSLERADSYNKVSEVIF
jgi:hypothetical protein